MDSIINSDRVLEFVIWVILAFAMLCATLLLIAVLFRVQALRRMRREQRLQALWQGQIHQAIVDGSYSATAPLRLKRRQRKDFLSYWSLMHAYVRGSGDTGLNQLAAAVDLPRWLTRYLYHPSLDTKLAALTALGYFTKANKEQETFVLQSLQSRNRLVSITALRCLLNLNSQRTLDQLAERLAVMDWSDGRLVNALREAPREPVLRVLDKAITQAPLRRAMKCYRLAAKLRGYTAQHTSDTLLQRFGDNTAALSQVLTLVNTPSSRADVIALIDHSDASIRAQALVALGRIGQLEDAQHLLPLLEDPDGWVRYDAASTLLLLPGVDDAQVSQWLEQLEAHSGARILLHSLARTHKAEASA